MPEKLLRISEVAKILDFSVSTIRNLCDSGKLRCVYPTGTTHRRIPQSALDDYLLNMPTSRTGNQHDSIPKPNAAQYKPFEVPAVFQRLGSGKYFRQTSKQKG